MKKFLLFIKNGLDNCEFKLQKLHSNKHFYGIEIILTQEIIIKIIIKL